MNPGKSVTLVLIFIAIALVASGLFWWHLGAPRRESLATLAKLEQALHAGGRAELLDLVVIPANVRGYTSPEQSEFLAKALTDEISPEGLAVLRKEGRYGQLREVFPAEAEDWASHAGVMADDCVAFRLERNGIRAEVVLLKQAKPAVPGRLRTAPYLIVRVNNVKQLALPPALTTTEYKP
jgi:hypothetical protein